MTQITVPYPENPSHVENLRSLALLDAQGFEGPDASLGESLFQYGLAWRNLGNSLLFIHRASHGKGFDRTTLPLDLDPRKEWDWVDWPEFLSFVGMEQPDWDALPLPWRVHDLVNYYGEEEIFGTTYWEGFQIAE